MSRYRVGDRWVGRWADRYDQAGMWVDTLLVEVGGWASGFGRMETFGIEQRGLEDQASDSLYEVL